jgi:dTDP-glucose 4,6-dehydratase
MNSQDVILILGINSFSGSVTASRLLESGFQVIGLSRSAEVALPYRAYLNSQRSGNLEFYEAGSNFSSEVVIDTCKRHNVGIILNFAAQSMVSQSWDEPWDWYETNCVWLSRLIFSLMKWGKVRKFLHYTTPEVYGSTSGWIKEGTPINPSTPYAISRAAGDLHILAEHKRNGFPVIFTRASNVFGPFQQRYRIIPKALISAASDKELELHGGGVSERSFIFMEDVASALIALIKVGNIGSTYHISTNKMVTIRRVVEMCYEAYGKDPSSFLRGVEERPGKDQAYMLDSSRLRGEIHWEDKVGLADGMLRTKDWVDDWLPELLLLPDEYSHRP